MKFKTCLTTMAASFVVGNAAMGQPKDGELEGGTRATIEIAEVRDGEVLLRFVGDAATSPVLWASSDLRTWEKIDSAAKTESGEFLAVDVAALGGASARFYRAGYLTDVEDSALGNEIMVGGIGEVVEQDSRSVDDGVVQTFSWMQTSSPITAEDTGSGNQNRAKDEPDAPCVEVSDSTDTTSGNDEPGVLHGVISSSNKSRVHFAKACSKVKVEGRPAVRFP